MQVSSWRRRWRWRNQPASSLTNYSRHHTQAGDLAIPLQILLLLTLLGFIPALLIAMTSFTRIVIVLSLLRQALGVQQVPPNQVLIGLALLLTIFIMRPVGERLHTQVVQPYLEQRLTTPAALQEAMEPLRDFHATPDP